MGRGQALQTDPDLADAHRMRGLIAMNHDWDRNGARDGLTRALQLGPGSAKAHLWNAGGSRCSRGAMTTRSASWKRPSAWIRWTCS